MKAINCTQCGATIEDVSERSLIISCGYCGARIMLSGQEAKPKPPVVTDPPELKLDSPKVSAGKIALIAGLVMLLPILTLVLVMPQDSNSEKSRGYGIASTPYPDPTVMPVWSVDTGVPDKPMPVVNYQPRVSWDGPNDMEHFESPEVDISSVSHLSSEEVKNTVFKNRVVKLRVVINTEGEIDEVETISGHPLLVGAATASAKSTIFSSRAKPTTRVLTYTFRVLKD